VDKCVSDVMSTPVIACTPDTPIRRVARRMREHDVSALVVVDDAGSLVGIISQTDLVTLRAFEDEWQVLRAEHVMIRSVVTTTPDTLLREASAQMIDARIHRLVVCDPGGDGRRPIGVLSMTDVVREMAGGEQPEE